MNTSSVIIDDTDTQIQYSPGWQQGGSTNEYKDTTTNAETKDAFFELKFIGKPFDSVIIHALIDWMHRHFHYCVRNTSPSFVFQLHIHRRRRGTFSLPQ